MCLTGRCDVWEGGARCQKCAPEWWGRVPAVVQRAVVQALFKHGGLRNCNDHKIICTFHMKLAFRQLVRNQSRKFLVVLMKEALCDHAGFTADECREWFAATS